MPRKDLKKSNIEQFVIAYLSKFRHANNKRSVIPFVEKAVTLIETFLNSPCCEDSEAFIGFGRRNDSLTTYIHAVLNNKFEKRKWKNSLDRTLVLLNNFINDPCCV